MEYTLRAVHYSLLYFNLLEVLFLDLRTDLSFLYNNNNNMNERLCLLNVAAFEFGVLDAMSGVRQMLVLVWSREQQVSNSRDCSVLLSLVMLQSGVHYCVPVL